MDDPFNLTCEVPIENPKLPLVTFIVPTYGRAARQPQLLNEAVYWLVNQEYPNVEVLVLNDCPTQTLTCDHERVRCINWGHRIATLGEKMNLGVLLAAGSICCPAEDDDISLLHRAEQAVVKLKSFDYWTPALWLHYHLGKTPAIDAHGWGHNCSAYRRAAMLGRYEPITPGHDKLIHIWAHENLRFNPYKLKDPSQVSYVYRWGVSVMHLSGNPDMNNAWAGFNPGKPGKYKIKPRATNDWQAVAESAAERYQVPQSL